MMCILLPISCWPFEKVLYFAQRLVSTAVTIISTFLCIIPINVVTKLFYLQTHQLKNFLYGEGFPHARMQRPRRKWRELYEACYTTGNEGGPLCRKQQVHVLKMLAES